MAVMSNEQLTLFSFVKNEDGVKVTPIATENENNGKIIDMPIQPDDTTVETNDASTKVETTEDKTDAPMVPDKPKGKRNKKSKTGEEKEEKKAKVKVNKEEKPKKKEVPSQLAHLNDEVNPEKFFKQLGFDGLTINSWRYNRGHFVINDSILKQEPSAHKERDIVFQTVDDEVFTTTMLYVESDGTMWSSVLKMVLYDRLYGTYDRQFSRTNYAQANIKSFALGKWHQNAKLNRFVTYMQTNDELENILIKLNPYAYKFCKDEGCPIGVYFQAPQIEILVKAGYEFPKQIYTCYILEQGVYDCFNRLCKPGKSPKEIFKTSKIIYTTLKNDTSLPLWDTYRKLDKFGRITPDSVRQAYDQGFSEKDLSSINSILNKNYNGKPVFTWTSLINYLGRLDTFEAIGREEAFMLLEDYLRMCGQLDIEPKIDGDSLKREHDVVARTVRQKKNEILAKQMCDTCEAMKVYDYEEKIYLIRGIRNYDDLIDEACQQHNCVASYANRIANRQSLIYVMREVANPNRSLITVELTPDGKNIRQKFLAYNRSIHNKAQSEFLERWLKHIAGIKLPAKNVNS